MAPCYDLFAHNHRKTAVSIRSFLGHNVVGPYRRGRLFSLLKQVPRLYGEWKLFKGSSPGSARVIDWFLQPEDATETTPFDPHYFYQSAWAARNISRQHPARHVDVGSQINLIAPLSGFVEVEFVDLRPLAVTLPGLRCVKGSVLSLPYADGSVQSLSCLHVIEHVGLGRYGDPIDPEGTQKACRELQRVLARHGHLYVTAPIGKERVEFNAHRVHHPETILRFFSELHLVHFSCVDDQGVYRTEAEPNACKDFNYGLGLFHFTRERTVE
jgi:Caenorhabditis protein of unknown function, DUF268